jgi:PIN domain
MYKGMELDDEGVDMKIIDDISAMVNSVLRGIEDQKLRTKQELRFKVLISKLRSDYSSIVTIKEHYLTEISELEEKITQLEKRIVDPWIQRAEEIAAISKRHDKEIYELSRHYEQKLQELSEQYAQELTALSGKRTVLNDTMIDIAPPRPLSTYEPPLIHFVVDTSVLIQSPRVIEELAYRKHRVYIPLSVIRELDKLKNSSDPEIAHNSRTVSASIDRGNHSIVCDRYEPIRDLEGLEDNRILGTAIWLQQALAGKTRFPDRNHPIIREIKWRIGISDKLVLLTADKNMRLVARHHGVIARGWTK